MDAEAIKFGLVIWAAISLSILIGVLMGLLLAHWLGWRPPKDEEHGHES